MLCLGLEGIIHYELLPPGKMIDATNQQLMRLIQEKRPELIKEKTLTIEKMLSFIMTTPDYTFDDSTKIERAWLGNFDASTVLTSDFAPSDFALLFVLAFAELP